MIYVWSSSVPSPPRPPKKKAKINQHFFLITWTYIRKKQNRFFTKYKTELSATKPPFQEFIDSKCWLKSKK